MSMLVRLSDVIDSKVQKEKELEFYQRELQKLNQKMAILREEITVTNIIIDLVRSEKVRDFKKEFEQK
jgi:prefoldin subunit 5